MARPVEIPVVVKRGTLSRSIEGEASTAFKKLGASSGAVAPLGRMLGKIRGDADEFTKSIEASNARVIAFGASVGIINGISNAFKQLVKVTVDVEKSLTDINVVLNASQRDLSKFGDGLFKVAKNTAQSFDVVAEAATEFARQGLTLEETLKRTQDALILTRLTGLKAADSVKGLTAATNGFAKAGLTTTQIINKLAAVDVKFAVSADDLIAALSRTGAVAQDAGISMDKLIGMVTAAQQVTARGGPVIGNAFKTIFTRVQRPATLKTLRELKIAVDDVSGAALPADRVLQNLANSYDGLSKAAKDTVNQQVAGVFQINILKAAVGDLQKQNSIAARATVVSANATDQAIQKNEMLNQTIAALSTQTGLALSELATKIGDIAVAPGLRDLVQSFKGLIEGMSAGLDGEGTGGTFARGLLKGIGNVLTGPGLIVIGGVFLKLFKDLTVFGVKSLKNLLGLNNAAKQQAALQAGIGQLLATNVQYEQQMAAAAGNLNKQAQITQTFLAREITMRQQAAALTGAMGGAAFRGGFRVDKAGTLGMKKSRIPGFAPTAGVPNFSRFAYRSPLAIATGDSARAGGSFAIGKSKLAKKMPKPFKRVAEGMDIDMSYGDILGLSAQGQAGMIGGMRSALGAGGYGAFGRGRMLPGVDPGLYGAQTLSGLQSAMKGVSPKARGLFDQKMAESVTEPYIAAHAQRMGGGSGGITGLLGGRQGKDTFFDALRLNPDRTYTPVEIKKRLMGEATKATMAKKSLYSETNPALRNEFFRRAESPQELKAMRDHIFSELHKAYDVYARAGIPGFGGHKGSFAQVKAVKKFHRAVNFAPIGDAIQREKHQVGSLLGISPSKVQTRVVQNAGLKTAFNPQGFGVISPTIGQKSFADAARMHKGEDLRTANLPNFALDIPGINPKKTPMGYLPGGVAEVIISGVKDEPAKKLGVESARAAIKETKKAYPPRPTGAPLTGAITTGVNTKAAADMARVGGGIGNTAMNAFLAYSAGTMLDPVGKAFGLEGSLTAGATGGYLGGVAGAKLGGRVFKGDSKIKSRLRKGSIGLGAGVSAMLAYQAGAFDSMEDFEDYIDVGGPFGANAMLPKTYTAKKREETAGFQSALDRLTRDALEASELQSIDALRLDTALQTRKVDRSTYGSLFNQVTSMRPTRQDREQKLIDRILSRRLPRPSGAAVDGGQTIYMPPPTAEAPAGQDTLPPVSISGILPPGGDFLRRQAAISRAQRLGVYGQGPQRDQSILNRERLSAKQMLDLEKSNRSRRDQLIKEIGAMDPAVGGAEGMIMRNVMQNLISQGKYGELKDIGDLAISGGKDPSGYTEAHAQMDVYRKFKELEREMEQRGLDPRRGIPEEIFEGRQTGYDSKQFIEFFRTFKEMNQQSGGFAQNVRDAANASGELAESFESARRISEVTDEIREMNAELVNTNKFIQNFAGSLGRGISQATQGAELGGVLRNLAMSIFGNINQIASQNIANTLTGALFPQGGKAESFITNMLKGSQTGGLIKAQNGMYISGSRTGDKNPALLEDGEYVLNRNAVAAMGGPGALDNLNFNMAPRFAEGGFFGGIGNFFKGIWEAISSIFGGGRGKTKALTPGISGAGTSRQSKRIAATNRMSADANQILSEIDAISARTSGAGTIPADSPLISGIRKRAAHSRVLKQIEAYGGITPGAVGREGSYTQNKGGVFSFGGGRPSPMSNVAIADVFGDALGIAREKGAYQGLVYLEQFYKTNPRAFDRLEGFPHGQTFKQKEGFFMDLFRRGGVDKFARGGSLVSPISQSGVSGKAMRKMLSSYPASTPMFGSGIAVGGGGGAGRLDIMSPQLSGYAHANDPTLQMVKSDVQDYHQKQRDKKFAKQAERDDLMQTIVGAAVSSVLNQGVGFLQGQFGAKPGEQGGRWSMKEARQAYPGQSNETYKSIVRTGNKGTKWWQRQSGGSIPRYGSGGSFRRYQEGGAVQGQDLITPQRQTGDSSQSSSSTSNTTINITVNSSTGTASTETTGEPGAQEREMAIKIRDAVTAVIKQEKRTGGMLRDVTAQDQ